MLSRDVAIGTGEDALSSRRIDDLKPQRPHGRCRPDQASIIRNRRGWKFEFDEPCGFHSYPQEQVLDNAKKICDYVIGTKQVRIQHTFCLERKPVSGVPSYRCLQNVNRLCDPLVPCGHSRACQEWIS